MQRQQIFCLLMFLGLFVATTQCVDPYNPPEIKEVVDILVVDGFLNCSDKSVKVHLSKALALSDAGKPMPEVDATVWIEDENGSAQYLSEIQDGTYLASAINIDMALQYRLFITTQDEARYSSDFIHLTTTPPIDSVSWKKSV